MTDCGFFKKVELKDAKFKYGFTHQGYFALEKIVKGEEIFRCNLQSKFKLQELF